MSKHTPEILWFDELDECKRSARSSLARLEAGVVGRFIELRDRM